MDLEEAVPILDLSNPVLLKVEEIFGVIASSAPEDRLIEFMTFCLNTLDSFEDLTSSEIFQGLDRRLTELKSGALLFCVTFLLCQILFQIFEHPTIVFELIGLKKLCIVIEH